MKNNRKARYRWFFYRVFSQATDGVDEWGTPVEYYTCITSGFFAKEVARKPIEIVDASAITSETQYVLIGAWVSQHEQITSGMIAYCPATNEYHDVVGDPVDPDGNHKREMIYVVKNAQRYIDTSELSVEYE